MPWLGFFHKAALSDVFVVLDDVQFEKNGFNNRNRIKASNGWCWLTVPVRKTGHLIEQKINSTFINNRDDWGKKHLKTLVLNYKKARCFDRYISFFEKLYGRNWEMLSDINFYALKWLLSTLGINTKVVLSSMMKDRSGAKSGLILNICKSFKADAYISGTLGKGYLDEESFREAGIKIVYQQYRHPQYSQLWGKFEPGMSIIDLLFNCGEESLDIVMKDNIAKKDVKNI